MSLADLTAHLSSLRTASGSPTFRQMQSLTNLGKTTIHEAFAGKRLPTWPVTRDIVRALGGDEKDTQRVWAIAAAPPRARTDIPPWLTDVFHDVPALAGQRGLEHACAVASTDPRAAVAAGWEVVRLSALQLSHRFYNVLPGNWSSNIVATFERAEADGLLPGGSASTAQSLHRVHVEQGIRPDDPVPVAVALQMVVLAHRLAWVARDVVAQPAELGDRPDAADGVESSLG
ncbi:hypothetical protein OG455_27155 [Kitasatospora sp. NBC_01287]|uniref:hypothetical protein n=1 Tax=Kitasatospora sp. NBC_01287 TaxID=2903573 RepID=UPI0022590693|nr:hypothetical protein [Kitasatospora sp. NBC_01287]MCX4749142.1 hypothetical protein [Kitasatospora sp. NBC_01287]